MSPVTEANLLRTLHRRHADEFAYLSQKRPKHDDDVDDEGDEDDQDDEDGEDVEDVEDQRPWIYITFDIIRNYILFVINTWVRTIWCCVFFPTTLLDRAVIILLSLAAHATMTVLLVWCILYNAPVLGRVFDWICGVRYNGMSLVNMFDPGIFEELPKEKIRFAKNHLSQPIESSGSTETKRIFNLDTSKLLLQCATLMYERSNKARNRAAAAVGTGRWNNASRNATMKKLHKSCKEEKRIREIARDKYGLSYSSVSELNSVGGAYCGLFWDPQEKFIIVAFRGTTPTDYTEWKTDFTFHLRDAGLWLRCFGKVHIGFMNKVFPRMIPPRCKRLPYSTIMEDIKTVSEHLAKTSPDKGNRKINVWITGHSLGSALASLFYSRLVNESRENITVRDAYVFAAPIVCDVASTNAFNGRMNRFTDFPRTLWRITNGSDFVATGLPDKGDSAEWLVSSLNFFSYAHLGCEIRIQPKLGRCEVRGSHITPGTLVKIVSGENDQQESQGLENGLKDTDSSRNSLEKNHVLDSIWNDRKKAESESQVEQTPRGKALLELQQLPLVGRLLAHAPGFYWAALQGVKPCTCVWVYE